MLLGLYRVFPTLAFVVLTIVLSASSRADAMPARVGFDQTGAGDTAWMLTSTVLVLLMTILGFALFYAGMVRKKPALAS